MINSRKSITLTEAEVHKAPETLQRLQSTIKQEPRFLPQNDLKNPEISANNDNLIHNLRNEKDNRKSKPSFFQKLFSKDKTKNKEITSQANVSSTITDSPSSPEVNINKNQNPKKKKRGPFGAIIFTLFLILIIIVGLFAAYIVPPILSIKASIDKIQNEGEVLKSDISAKDFTTITSHLTNVQIELKNVREKLNTLDFMQNISFLAPYYKNIEVTKEILENTDLLITKAQPKIDIFTTNLDSAIKIRIADEQATANATVINEPSTPVEVDPTQTITPNPPVNQTNAEMCAVKNKDNVELKQLGVESTTLAENKKVERQAGNTKLRDIVSVLPEAIDIYTEVEPEIQILLNSINKLDPEALPSFTPSKYKDLLSSVLLKTKDTQTNFPKYSELIKSLVTKLPDLLGSKKPVTYLIIFQNEKEMRASGGLLTAYGIITLDKGNVVGEIVTRDMWDLQGDIWAYSPAINYYNIYGQLWLMENGCGASELRSQDSGIYPDLQTSMKMFTKYYDNMQLELPEKYPVYDNVVILNTFFASDMVSLIQPLVMDDCSIVTSENLAKVIFDKREAVGERKSNIGRVAKAAEKELTSISSSKLPDVITTLIKTIEAKNIAFSSKDPAMQEYFDKLGLTARIKSDFQGDYFHLNEAQVCGLKANFYLYDTVQQTISIADNGTVSKSVRVEWVNEKVYDPNENEIISSSRSFPYRAWIRFMAPPGTDFIYTDGYAKSRYLYYPENYYDAPMDKEVNDNVIWFEHRRMTEADPVRTYDLNVAYNLPEIANYTEEKGYQMLIQKHPGKKAEKYIISISYKGKEFKTEFILDRDKVVSLKNDEIKVTDYINPLDDYNWMLKSIGVVK
jgi:hypothetical protein